MLLTYCLRRKVVLLKATSGMPMIQFSLLAMMKLEKEGIISIEEIVKTDVS